MGHDPWEGPERDLKAGYLRMHLIVVNGDNGGAYVQLQRISPAETQPTILWYSAATKIVNVETEPILITAGTYRVRLSIKGDWSVTLEQ